MQLFRILFLCSLTFCLFIIAGCQTNTSDEKNPVVAEYAGNKEITFVELNKYINDWMINRMYNDKYTAYHKGLNIMLVNSLKRIDFFERGLNKDSVLVESIMRYINQEVVVEYYNEYYRDKYVNEELLKRVYNDMHYEVVYRQIVFQKPTEASQEQLDSLKEKVLEVKKKIDDGENFGEMIIQYSDDNNSVQMGGFADPVTWKASLMDKTSNAVFKLNVGDIRVLESEEAFSIVEVTDKNEINVKPYEEVKPQIEKILRENNAELTQDDFNKEKTDSFNAEDIKWNDKALAKIIEWTRNKRFTNGGYVDTLNNAIARGNNFVILTYPNGQVDLEEFLRLQRDILLVSHSSDINEKEIKDYFVEAIRTDLVVKKARKLNLIDKVFNANTENSVIKDRLVYLYNKAVIYSQIPEPTPEASKNFYESQKDSLYYQLETTIANIMVFPNENEAKAAMKKIDEGIAFEQVTRKFLVRVYEKDRSGEIKLYRSSKDPVFADVAFPLKDSEITGPVEFNDPEKGRQYAVIKCKQKIEERQKTYDEVQKSIVKDFEDFYRAKIDKEISAELLNKYNAEIYEDVLDKKIATVK